MKRYKQLTSEQRYQISGLKKASLKQEQIADEVGMNKSTISRELRRNKGQCGWQPKQAQELRDKQRQACTNAKQFSLNDWAEVERLIQQDMNPDQAGRGLALEDSLQISHETIYQYIYADKRRGMIPNRVSIDERPEIVDQKIRIGDWEGDTVIGKNHRGALVTLAERKSRYVLASKVTSKHAKGVTAAVTRLLRPHSHTVTFDNGKEFSAHEKIAADLKADIYFAHPYRSWERGLNENSNGLLRQYFPKGTELTDVIQEQVE